MYIMLGHSGRRCNVYVFEPFYFIHRIRGQGLMDYKCIIYGYRNTTATLLQQYDLHNTYYRIGTL